MLDCVWKGCDGLWVFIVYFSNILAISWLPYILRKKPRQYITSNPMQFHAFSVWKYNLEIGVGRESSSWVRDINICCPESITLSTRLRTTSSYLNVYQQREQSGSLRLIFYYVLYSPETNLCFCFYQVASRTHPWQVL